MVAGDTAIVGGFALQLDLTGAGGRQQVTLSALLPEADGRHWVSREVPGLAVTLSLRADDAGIEIGVQLAPSVDEWAIHALQLVADLPDASFLRGLGQTADFRVFLAGYNSFSPAICRDSRERFRWPRFEAAATFNQYAESVYFGRDEYLSTPWYATFSCGKPAQTLLVGWLAARVGLGEVALRRDTKPALEARLSFGGKTLRAGQILTCESLRVVLSEPGAGEGLLSEYVDEVARQMEARRLTPVAPTGWCSWYYYYTRVAEDTMRRNLSVLQADRAALPLRYVQLDDGYQNKVGDWLLPNAKFGSSLASLGRLAASIREAGFTPGIWVAPFIVQRSAQLFAQHPDFVLPDRDGKRRRIAHHLPWGITDGQIYALDLSHPKVLAHLDKVFRALRELGFGYFKIDFLSAGLRDGRRHDPSQSPLEAFRRALAVIRAAVGDDFLLGCGAPILPAVGLCDGLRVSSDVKEQWRDSTVAFFAADCGHPAAELAIWNDLTRAHLHRRWFLNDPDCLLVRERDSKLTRPEIETLCSVLSISGGALFLSDDMSRLASERRALAEQTLPVCDKDAREHAYTPGLLTEPRPWRFLRRRDRDGQPEIVAAVLNWDDAPARRSVALTDLGFSEQECARYRHIHCYERWSDSYALLNVDEPLPLPLPPHGTALLLLQPQSLCPKTGAPRPQLVGLTHHLSGPLFVLTRESWDGERLELQLTLELGARRTGELLLHVPSGYGLRDASADSPARIKLQPEKAGGLLRFVLDVDDRTHVRLRFSRS
jgi:alpha-galactosidase